MSRDLDLEEKIGVLGRRTMMVEDSYQSKREMSLNGSKGKG